MTRPRITEWPYADPDQQDEPVPDVPLMAALVAVVWRLRWWIGIGIAAAWSNGCKIRTGTLMN